MWRPGTPAMAAGLTNRVWSLKEGLRYLVPPWLQSQAREQVGQKAERQTERESVSTRRQGGVNEELKCDARPDHRLIDLTQTPHKGTATIIRPGRVHAP